MSDFFGDLKSGIKFPEVVMNSGPLPPSGGLPAPLHENADAKINYNSTLLGNLEPYAYGKPGYLSSQTAYLNIPHKIQKIVPVVHLPEAKVGATDTFELSHPIDDGDIAFTIRLNRNSIFCTGLKNGEIKRAGLSGIVDPMINLCTLNYLLSGFQIGLSRTNQKDMWHELLYNMDAHRFPQGGVRDYVNDPINLQDLIHVVRHCIRPMGITRGSEKQGGQNEATQSPVTWPVSFVVSLTIDGKESNVVNVWHKHNMSAGDDLVLRFKLMPLRQYTLNHYYKRVTRQNWGNIPERMEYVWQLVPDIMHLDSSYTPSHAEMVASLPLRLRQIDVFYNNRGNIMEITSTTDWQNLGYWHIGRSQIMSGAYGTDEYWNNDLANVLKTNHLDITFQPMFTALPMPYTVNGDPHLRPRYSHHIGAELSDTQTNDMCSWKPTLRLESMFGNKSSDTRLYGSQTTKISTYQDSEHIPLYQNTRNTSLYPDDENTGLYQEDTLYPDDENTGLYQEDNYNDLLLEEDPSQLVLTEDARQQSFEDLGLDLFEFDSGPSHGLATRSEHIERVSQTAALQVPTDSVDTDETAIPLQTVPSHPPPSSSQTTSSVSTSLKLSTPGKETNKQVKRKAIGGSLLKADGSSEAKIVAML